MDDDDTEADERRPLLRSASPRPLSYGERYVVAADAAAVIMCRRRQPVCCLRSNLEFFSIPDGSVVEIVQPDLAILGSGGRDRVVGVRVIASVDGELRGMLGSIRLRWLQAYKDFLSAMAREKRPRPRPITEPNPDQITLRQTRSWWPLVDPEQKPNGAEIVQGDGQDPVMSPPRPGERRPGEGAGEVANGDDDGKHGPVQDGTGEDEGIIGEIRSSMIERKGLSLSNVVQLLTKSSTRYEFSADVVNPIAERVLRRISAKPPQITISKAVLNGLQLTIHVSGGRQILALTSPREWVLENERVVPRPSETRKLAIRDEILFDFSDDGGIAGVRSGDIMLKGIININVKVRSETCPGRIDTDQRGRPIIVSDGDGNPIRNAQGEYRLKRFDEWIVVTALRKSIWIGIDRFHPEPIV